MFGQEPRLPVDFLLGQVSDPIAGEPHEWIVEHQTRLQLAFDGAKERLRATAQRRKVQYDQHVRDEPLGEGQLVLVRNTGVRGRCKTHDLWSSVPHVVLRAPPDGGSVYTIAPEQNQDRARQVHRSLIKPFLRVDPPEVTQNDGPSLPIRSLSSESSCEEDLWYVASEGPLAWEFIPSRSDSHPPLLAPTQTHAVEREIPVAGQSSSPVDLPVDLSNQSLRKSSRPTAGRHPNPHNLPRSVLDN